MLCFENGLIPLRISCFEYKIPTKDIFLLVLYFSTDKENSIIVENKNTAMSFIMHYETWSFPLFVTNYPKRIIFEKKKKKNGEREITIEFFAPLFSRVTIIILTVFLTFGLLATITRFWPSTLATTFLITSTLLPDYFSSYNWITGWTIILINNSHFYRQFLE